MGSNTSKTSKIERKERNEIRGTKINNNINNIKQFEEKIIESARTNSVNSTEIVNYDELKTYLDITSSATQQLMRDGKPFTKKDYIAIITALHPEQIANIKSLDTLTVTDLISMIRCTIYDMNRYMNHGSSNHMQAQSGYESTDLTIIQNRPALKNVNPVDSNQLVVTSTLTPKNAKPIENKRLNNSTNKRQIDSNQLVVITTRA